MSRFEDTHWSLVLRAGHATPDATAALATLCDTYRSPVLAYIRRQGHAPDVAEDLTQSFFLRLIESAWHRTADPARGRFRSFLLTAVRRYLIDQAQESRRLKRGGGYRFESLTEADRLAMPESGTPDAAFEHDWAIVVLNNAFGRLRDEARHAGKLRLFDTLRPFLVERPVESDYAKAAEALNLRRNTLAVAVYRLRYRLRELVREAIADTTVDADELDREMHVLRSAFDTLLEPDRDGAPRHGRDDARER